jgi:hypothetical protein
MATFLSHKAAWALAGIVKPLARKVKKNRHLLDFLSGSGFMDF